MGTRIVYAVSEEVLLLSLLVPYLSLSWKYLPCCMLQVQLSFFFFFFLMTTSHQ